MAKTALCIGPNHYPGTKNDLAGCVNDAHDWAAALKVRGFAVSILLDAQVGTIRDLIDRLTPGDSTVITYSGYGTFVPDPSGEEPDARDEGVCPYDIGRGKVLLDHEIHALLRGVRRGPGSC